MSTFDERDRMAEAYDTANVPATRDAGPGTVTLFEPPQGAMQVAVRRDLGNVRRAIGQLAKAMGDEFFYRWPVKNKDGSTDWVEGISVKGTNAVSRIYGNNQCEVRALDMGDHFMLYARFIDFETGYVLVRPFQQRKGQNIGSKYDGGRAQDIVFQIGVSKATRNVVANALTEFTDYAFEEAKAAIVGIIAKDPEGYRGKINQRLQGLDVTVDRVERRRGRTMDKWTATDMALVVAEIQSVNDNMAHPDEMWPRADIEAPRPNESQFKETPPEDKKPAPEKPAEDKKTEPASSPSGPSAVETKTAENENKNAGAPSTSATVPAADPDPEDDRPTKAVLDAQDSVNNYIATLSQPDVDLDQAKKAGRTLIDNLPGIDDDQRDVLRGQFTTAVLQAQKAKQQPRKRK